jgi:hypothetical protein
MLIARILDHGGRHMNLRSRVDLRSSTPARRGLVGGAAGLLLLCATGCGGSTVAPSLTAGTPTGSAATPAASTSAASGTHEFRATLQVTGTVTQSTSFTMSLTDLPSCSSLAQTGAGSETWSVPISNSTTFFLNWNVTPYTGPGTFTDPTLFQNSVELDAPYQGTVAEFDQVSGSVLSITVKSDGSGSATFSDLQDALSNTISGSETWTCS